MGFAKPIIMNCIGGRTENLQGTKGKGESITHQNLIVPQIQTRNLPKVVVILNQIYLHHLTQVPPVMTGRERGKDPGKTGIDVEKEETNNERRDEGNKTKNQSVDQEGIDSD